jgi:hypothetical protein
LTGQNAVEVLSLQLSGGPAAGRLSAGVDLGDGVWSLTTAQLAGLTLLPDDNFNAVLTLTATSTDAVYNRTASTSASFTVAVADVPPMGTLTNDGPIDVGGTAVVSFLGVADPSPVDTAAGFRFSFALDPTKLATRYAQAGTSLTQSFPFDQSAGTFPVFARVFDKDGGFTDASTIVVVRVVAPTAVLLSGEPTVEGGTTTASFVNAFDRAAADRAAGFHFAFDFNNDGVFEVGDGTYTGSSDVSSVSIPLAVLGRGPGDYTVHGRIIAADGGFTDYRIVVTVLPLQTAPPDLILLPLDAAAVTAPAPSSASGAAPAMLTNVAASLLQSSGTSAAAKVEAPPTFERAADVSSRILPAPLGVVDAAQLHSAGSSEETAEQKGAGKALGVASAILSGDDSVGLIEDLLRRAGPQAPRGPKAAAPTRTEAAPDARKTPAVPPQQPETKSTRAPARLPDSSEPDRARPAGPTWTARLLWPWLAAASALRFVVRPRPRNGLPPRKPSPVAPGVPGDDPRA